MGSTSLDTITVKGFKSIASIEKLKLGDINVVIGPNGSGKSNFIGVFAFLHAIRAGHLQDYMIKSGGADKVLHFGAKVTQRLDIHVSFKGERYQYRLSLAPTDGDELVPTTELVYFWDKVKHPDKPYSEGVARVGKEAGISAQNDSKIATFVRDHLDRWRVYHFHDTGSTSPMKKTADINDNRYLRQDGSNLAAFLYYLREKHETAYSMIRRTVQRVAPFFDDFQLEPQKLNPDKIRLEWRHNRLLKYPTQKCGTLHGTFDFHATLSHSELLVLFEADCIGLSLVFPHFPRLTLSAHGFAPACAYA